MSKPPAFESPLAAFHHEARRLASPQHQQPGVRPPDLLYGRRALKKPLIALTTSRELGPCRHALSQMVVAGVMTTPSFSVPLPVSPHVPNQSTKDTNKPE